MIPSKKSEEDVNITDIIGDWGPYQWSLIVHLLFAGALINTTIVLGPIWTPEMRHVCSGSQSIDFMSEPHQCSLQTGPNKTMLQPCDSFIYDEEQQGKILTNSFDLVCSRKWLRSFTSSSALTGLLLSSVTLGLLSDRFGRMRCLWIGSLISIFANIGAIVAPNYFLLNVCIMLMSYGQIGVSNASCTLLVECSSPRWRFVTFYVYGLGWGLGILLTPILNALTLNYQLFLFWILLPQLLMLAWVKFCVFESIRWLMSEGQLTRAREEMLRARRVNRLLDTKESSKNSLKDKSIELKQRACDGASQADIGWMIEKLERKHTENSANEQQDEGVFAKLTRLFHKKLYKTTIILMIIITMHQTTYFGLLESNKFIGSSVDTNYVAGALVDWLADVVYVLILYKFSRRVALIGPTVTASLICMGIALSYYFCPDEELRQTINFWLLTAGKFILTVAIQIASTISMEVYPNSVRQTGAGVTALVGRLGSIAAPFMFVDQPEQLMIVLVALGAVGMVSSALVPIFVSDTKDKDLCDHLNDIEEVKQTESVPS